MIAIVTDSASMLPDDLRRRYDVSVVPLTITLDGTEFAEGHGPSNAEFYDRLAAGATVSTSAPSPGAFAERYHDRAQRGATAMLSIHTGSNYSATVAAATLAAALIDIDVHIVDTGVASFPVSLCVWAAAASLAEGATSSGAATAARTTAAAAGSLFVVGAPDVARRGGRFGAVDGELTPTTVLELAGGTIREHRQTPSLHDAIELMVDQTRELARRTTIRVGVGHAMRRDAAQHLLDRLTGTPGIHGITRYEVGPSVGAHTGPGTLGVVYAPA